MAQYTDDTAHLKELIVSRTYTSTLPSGQSQTPINFILKSEVRLGSWANAMNCTLDLGTSGSANGLASAGTSTLIPPNGSLSRGALYSHIFEIGAGASSTWGSAGPVAFLKFDSWGTAAYVDDNAFFMDIQGLNAGNDNMWDQQGPAASDASLKIRIGSTTYWIMLSTTPT